MTPSRPKSALRNNFQQSSAGNWVIDDGISFAVVMASVYWSRAARDRGRAPSVSRAFAAGGRLGISARMWCIAPQYVLELPHEPHAAEGDGQTHRSVIGETAPVPTRRRLPCPN